MNNPEPENRAKVRYMRKVAWLVGILALLTVVWGFYIFGSDRRVPPELLGVWTTSDPQYADRFFEIAPVSVSFGTGDAKELTGFIGHIETSLQNDRILYTITYSADGQDSVVSFSYAPKDGNAIRFKNQEHVIWTKKPESK